MLHAYEIDGGNAKYWQVYTGKVPDDDLSQHVVTYATVEECIALARATSVDIALYTLEAYERREQTDAEQDKWNEFARNH
jgi:hypothetical protein